MSKQKWLGEALGGKPGALHRQLDIPEGQKIPKTLMVKIMRTPVGFHMFNPTKTGKPTIKVTGLLKRRVNPVLTARGFKRRKRGRVIY